jgi:hypothetical protein
LAPDAAFADAGTVQAVSYLASKNGTPGNAVHWTFDPLDYDSLALLRRIEDGGRLCERDRLNVAYLVARGCLHMDLDAWTYQITEKGEDALSFYGSDP